MTIRKGSRSRVLWYPETSPGVDPSPATSYQLPLADVESLDVTRDLIPAPIWSGDRAPFSSILGMKNAQGGLPLGLEFKTKGVLLKAFTGGSAAAITQGVSVPRYAHYFQSLNQDPLSGQLQKNFRETTALFKRAKGVFLDTMRYTFNPAGVARYELAAMGNGDEALTDLAGTPVNHGYSGKSYFNGMIIKGLTTGIGQAPLGQVAGFELTLGNKLQRADSCFNDGLAYEIVPGNLMAEGSLTLWFRTQDDFAFYTEAVNNSQIRLECLWSDLPVPIATEWLHYIFGIVKFSQGSLSAGGEGGIRLTQKFQVEYDDTSNGPCALEPWVISDLIPDTGIVIDGTHKIVPVKVDGAAEIDIDLTAIAGSNVLIDAIVTAINANGSFSPVGVADIFPRKTSGVGGRIRLRSKTKGTTGSIQLVGAVANTLVPTLGFPTTVMTGKAPTPWHVWLVNGLSAQY